MSRKRVVAVFDGVGTDGRVDGSVLAPCVDRLAAKIGADTRWFPWGGSTMLNMGGGGTWADNSRAGVADLAAWMDANPHQHIVLMSFSGGSKPAHDFLLKHPRFHNRVLAAGFLSDPWRPRDRWQHGLASPTPRYGVMGERYTPIPDRALWTTVDTDPISSAYPDALLRYLADTSDGNMDQIITKAIEHGRLGTFQLFWQLGIIQRDPLRWFLGMGGRIGQLAADVRAYMFDGAHTKAYHVPVRTPDGKLGSRSDRLADSLAWLVNNRP